MKIILLLCTGLLFGDITMKEVIEQYSPEYCRLLEAAYGEGMMSEGGEALALMFKDVSIQGKKALDIGSGLGGVAYYLAKEHDCQVTGLEINPWMVKEAEERAPKEIKNKLDFVLSTSNDHLPFDNESFDVVYSRGVFCHIENKQGILNECYRILKPGGVLVVNDFLSSIKGNWGEHVKRLVELEGLPIYAETIDGYIEVLNKAEFKGTKVLNLTEKYALYNEEIVSRLKTSEKKEAFIQSFNEKLHAEAIEGYSAIAQAMQKSEGMIVQFVAHKEKGLENGVHLESSLKNTLTQVYQLDEAASAFISDKLSSAPASVVEAFIAQSTLVCLMPTTGEGEIVINPLDALLSAPKTHRLLFENASLRVLESRIEPGESVPPHTHQWDSVYVILQGSRFIGVNQEGHTIEEEWEPGVERFKGDAPDSSLYTYTNVSPKPFYSIAFEIKK
ncbi:MAG: methyltransferase domain-containing protein [Chlamydiales bacterium]|nr:methyltransferase domain-containing protein [Chlamydiales bacterium]